MIIATKPISLLVISVIVMLSSSDGLPQSNRDSVWKLVDTPRTEPSFRPSLIYQVAGGMALQGIGYIVGGGTAFFRDGKGPGTFVFPSIMLSALAVFFIGESTSNQSGNFWWALLGAGVGGSAGLATAMGGGRGGTEPLYFISFSLPTALVSTLFFNGSLEARTLSEEK